ncbi:MAG: cyclic nucleotide-binding domain-containing protein [Anaerolineae bacterium]|nr:MAG: cyclic nucleotide-binding domain-containing protein [Anaerolineae bacterium]
MSSVGHDELARFNDSSLHLAHKGLDIGTNCGTLDSGDWKGGKRAMPNYVIWLNQVQARDMTLVGQKGGHLGQMSANGLPVPTGFCVTVDAYQAHIAASDLWPQIGQHLDSLSTEDPAGLERIADLIQGQVYEAAMPAPVQEAIEGAAQKLFQRLEDPSTPLAVRPSTVVEGQPPTSFGGQHDAFLNVIGPASLLESIKKCWASLWTARAILFRQQNGLDHTDARMAVVVHELVSATVSGTVFTANPVTGGTEVLIDAVWGLSEAIISESVTPDNYVVRRADLALVDRWVSDKHVRLMPLADGGTQIQPVSPEQRARPCLSDDEIRALAKLCLRVEDLLDEPADIEFACHHGHFYLLQSRPIAALFDTTTTSLEEEMAHRLREVALLAPLDGEGIRQVARWARLQHYPAGATIIQQGEPGSDFYILASGRVAVRAEVARGKRRFLGSGRRGFFFGETALLTGDRRNATITAVEPSEVFVFDRESFEQLHKLHPSIEEEIRLRMEGRLRLTRIVTGQA